ncbi:MAG: molybdopterin-dependent oxidoreductase [Chloroflexi bacterium]|nr:molybdopterin-dependent oxidoreductase [Chloroflexota bacterium]
MTRWQRWQSPAARLAPYIAALAAQFLLRMAWRPAPFVPYAVGDWLIRRTPGALATDAIDRFGSRASDLLTGAIVIALVAGAVAAPRARPALAGLIAFAITILASWVEPVAVQPRAAVAAAIAASGAAWLTAEAFAGRRTRPGMESRRRFVAASGALGVVAVMAGAAALARGRAPRPRERLAITSTLASDGAFSEVRGLSPRITAPADHYVVDIDLNRPAVDADGWRLEVDGEVEAPRTFSFEEIRAMPATEVPLLLQCISNPVGGKLVSNGAWVGFPLARLLDVVSPTAAATALRVTAADGYDETVDLADQETVLVAYALGGEVLPPAHGYPVRLLFPGRYGMRSVKWVAGLQLVAESGKGYWERRGWSDEAIMRTGARIDTPRDGARLTGPAVAAGVAWAGDRGVALVELSTDGGRTWREAQLEAPASALSWRRWQLPLDLGAGKHDLVVRATDATGQPQDTESRSPHPSGVAGLHKITVRV